MRGMPQAGSMWSWEKSSKLLLACKDGGGFVLGASNAVQPEVPVANYRAMIEAWKQHGAS